MEGGNLERGLIVSAIFAAEKDTRCEIRVHLSKAWFERSALARAFAIFRRFEMSQTPERNSVLLYVNLRKRRLAVIGDSGVHEKVGQNYWSRFSEILERDLRTTHCENAIAGAVTALGQELSRYFPAQNAASSS